MIQWMDKYIWEQTAVFAYKQLDLHQMFHVAFHKLLTVGCGLFLLTEPSQVWRPHTHFFCSAQKSSVGLRSGL